MLSHHFKREFQFNKLKAPRNFQLPVINHSKNIFLEIGAGKGKHAIEFAKTNPNAHLFAIERTKEKFQAFSKSHSLESDKFNSLKNLQPIHADAIPWVVHALPARCLKGVFILYPNPEPNNANQRWFNMPFFEFLLSRMQDDATIVLASNIHSYIEDAHTAISNVWQLDCYKSDIPSHFERTHFEKKYLQRGEPCWQLNITKPKDYKTRFDNV